MQGAVHTWVLGKAPWAMAQDPLLEVVILEGRGGPPKVPSNYTYQKYLNK